MEEATEIVKPLQITNNRPLNELSYKELQNVAMFFHLPANLKQSQMLTMIQARQEGQEEIVDRIIIECKTSRLRRVRRRSEELGVSNAKPVKRQRVSSANDANQVKREEKYLEAMPQEFVPTSTITNMSVSSSAVVRLKSPPLPKHISVPECFKYVPDIFQNFKREHHFASTSIDDNIGKKNFPLILPKLLQAREPRRLTPRIVQNNNVVPQRFSLQVKSLTQLNEGASNLVSSGLENGITLLNTLTVTSVGLPAFSSSFENVFCRSLSQIQTEEEHVFQCNVENLELQQYTTAEAINPVAQLQPTAHISSSSLMVNKKSDDKFLQNGTNNHDRLTRNVVQIIPLDHSADLQKSREKILAPSLEIIFNVKIIDSKGMPPMSADALTATIQYYNTPICSIRSVPSRKLIPSKNGAFVPVPAKCEYPETLHNNTNDLNIYNVDASKPSMHEVPDFHDYVQTSFPNIQNHQILNGDQKQQCQLENMRNLQRKQLQKMLYDKLQQQKLRQHLRQAAQHRQQIQLQQQQLQLQHQQQQLQQQLKQQQLQQQQQQQQHEKYILPEIQQPSVWNESESLKLPPAFPLLSCESKSSNGEKVDLTSDGPMLDEKSSVICDAELEDVNNYCPLKKNIRENKKNIKSLFAITMSKLNKCPLEKCSWTGRMRIFSSHLQAVHKKDITMGEEGSHVVPLQKLYLSKGMDFFQQISSRMCIICVRTYGPSLFATIHWLPNRRVEKIPNIHGVLEVVDSLGRPHFWQGKLSPIWIAPTDLYDTKCGLLVDPVTLGAKSIVTIHTSIARLSGNYM